MKKFLVAAAIVGAFVLTTGSAHAQQGDPKKKIKGKIDPEMIKKLIDTIGGGDGKLDPEAISKMIEKLSQGHVKIDPVVFQKLMDKIAKDSFGQFGKIDADALFKKLDTDKDGKLTKKEFLKIAEEFKDKIGENRLDLARTLLGKRYDELDPTGAGLTLEQFRKEVARFQKEQAGK
jgi:Ca2+-binding EF-hand superfamily protein